MKDRRSFPHLLRWPWKLVASTFLTLGLTGCAPSIDEGTRSDQERFFLQSQEAFRKLRNARPSTTQVHWEEPWVEKVAIPDFPQKALPPELNQEVAFRTLTPISLREFFSLFLKVTGLPLRLTADAEAKLMGLYVTQGPGQNPAAGARAQSKPNGKGQQDAPESVLSEELKSQSYQGRVSDVLNQLASELGLFWKYSEKQVELYYLDTKIFQLQAISSDSSLSVQINSQGSAEASGGPKGGVSQTASGGNSSQNASMSIKSNVLEDVKTNLEMLLTPGIGRYSMSASTGAITVCDTATALQKIQDYIDRENRLLTKQILINVKVLSVNLKDSRKTEIDWNAVAEFMGSTFQLGNGKVPVEAPLLQFEGTLNAPPIGTPPRQLTLKSLNLFLCALAEQGEISVLTSPSVTTLNLHHVPLQVAEQENYISKESSTTTKNSDGTQDTTRTIDPATISTGLNMSLLPFAMENNDILLQYSINLSELVSIETLGDRRQQSSSANSGGESNGSDSSDGYGDLVQLPKVSNRVFSQKVKIQSGRTLVLSGFEQVRSALTETSPFFFSWLKKLLGNGSHEKQQTAILILITPVVID